MERSTAWERPYTGGPPVAVGLERHASASLGSCDAKAGPCEQVRGPKGLIARSPGTENVLKFDYKVVKIAPKTGRRRGLSKIT